jgi:hypothetical protein
MENKWKKIVVILLMGLLIGTTLLPNLSGKESFLIKPNSTVDNQQKPLAKIRKMIDSFYRGDTDDTIDQIYQNNIDDKVTVCLKKYDAEKGLIDRPIGSISFEKACMLKDTLADIWKSSDSLSEKIKASIDQLDEVQGLQFSLKNIFKSSYHQNDDTGISNTRILTTNTNDEVFNFLSGWGAFCVGQPNVYLFIGDRNITKYVIKETTDSENGGYNMSFFLEYGASGLMLPFIGWGYFGTAGLFGIDTLQNPMFASPNSFFALIIGTLFVSLSFKIGDPYLSMFELYLGVAGFPIAFPI